ncbi:MAG: Zn-dependent exopeptidase M28 [Anaerolineae bacterium]|nr:Zn-dependent exopeptidase M28 [Anaerolineae bacterium]
MEQLQGEKLKTYVSALADEIGPRPAGHPEEAQARAYLCEQLKAGGIMDIEEFTFPTIDTWGYAMIIPALLVVAGGLIASVGWIGTIIGGLMTLFGLYHLWQATIGRIQYQLLYPLYPKQPAGGMVLARIPAAQEAKHRVVLIGHTDSNKHRLSFSPLFKRGLQVSSSFMLLAAGFLLIAILLNIQVLMGLFTLAVAFSTAVLIVDEFGGFVDGANDNASAVACTLGIGKQAAQQPFQHVEVWLAFTGSEEVGHMGLNAVLNKYASELRDAWFIDFELVGSGRIAYVKRHSGLTYFRPYYPDADSVALASETTRMHPELKVTGENVVILEEVATLRRRGLRGICLVGLDDTGWLKHWHRYSDNSTNIEASALQQAAQFAWSMIEILDRRKS